MRIKRQNDYKDCGLSIIESLYNFYHRKSADLEEIRKDSSITEKGISIQSLIELGDKYGIEMEAFTAPFEAVNKKENENQIMVALIESEGNGHYIIFKKEKESYLVLDPAKGKYRLSENEFKNIYKDVVITTESKNVQEHSKQIKSLLHLVKSDVNILVWVLVSLLIGVTISFVSTLYMKTIVDYVLPGRLSNTLTVLTFGFASLALLRVLNTSLRKFLIRKIELNIEIEINLAFIHKLKSIEQKQLNKFTKTDLLRRMSFIEQVSSFVSSGLFLVISEIAVLIISTSLLLWISPSLFAITFAAGTIAMLTTIAFHVFINSEYEPLLNEQMKMMESRWDLLTTSNELKFNKYSKFVTKEVETNFYNYKTREMRVWNSLNFQSLFLELINSIVPIIMTFISVNLIFKNQLSVGTMMMFLGVFTSFISPLLQLCTFAFSYKRNKKNYDLLSSFISLEDEVDNPNGIIVDKIKNISLVNYGYKIDKQILNIPSFKVGNNKRLSGHNGTGKSTLLKTLAFRNDQKGILVNGIEVEYYSLQHLRNKVYIVSPETDLISTSIIEQVTLGDKKAIRLLETNIQRFNMKTIFDHLNLNLNNSITNGGQNLSSGQKQFVKLLRLFAIEFDLILLDEAFENIDSFTFNFLKEVLCELTKNSLVIEVSHSNRYIHESEEVKIEEINMC